MDSGSLKIVSAYNIMFLALYSAGLMYFYFITKKSLPEELEVWVTCICVGGIGGTLYCLRGAYYNACVKGDWNEKWAPWYYLRPITSAVSGAVACLFLKAGLILLESNQDSDSNFYAFYVLAFVAGYNVDNFLKRIEEVAKTTFSIEHSRSSSQVVKIENKNNKS